MTYSHVHPVLGKVLSEEDAVCTLIELDVSSFLSGLLVGLTPKREETRLFPLASYCVLATRQLLAVSVVPADVTLQPNETFVNSPKWLDK